MDKLSDEMRALELEARAESGSAEMDKSFVDRILELPRELFDMVIGEMTISQQANLMSTNKALYDKVLPVMDSFIWNAPSKPLPQMLNDRGQLHWEYVKQAEKISIDMGKVACPWCNIVHSPLRCLDDGPGSRFLCAGLPPLGHGRPNYLPPQGFDKRPNGWHPLMLYAFAVWSANGRDTTPLRDAAGLDYSREVLDPVTNAPTTRDQWKLNWVPGHGLFARWQHSELILPDDTAIETNKECCGCAHTFQYYDRGTLNEVHGEEAQFDQDCVHIFHMPRPRDIDQTGSRTTMLSGKATKLNVGVVDGCHECGMDFQFAWEEFDTQPLDGVQQWLRHWLHFTTWFHLGRDFDIQAVCNTMQAQNGQWHNSARSGPADCEPLGIGQVAALSGMPVEY